MVVMLMGNSIQKLGRGIHSHEKKRRIMAINTITINYNDLANVIVSYKMLACNLDNIEMFPNILDREKGEVKLTNCIASGK